jgi:hypothetical protein
MQALLDTENPALPRRVAASFRDNENLEIGDQPSQRRRHFNSEVGRDRWRRSRKRPFVAVFDEMGGSDDEGARIQGGAAKEGRVVSLGGAGARQDRGRR